MEKQKTMVFTICLIGGIIAASLISITLLLVALDKLRYSRISPGTAFDRTTIDRKDCCSQCR